MIKRENLRFLTESGIMLGLAIILSLLKIYQFPFGGAVTAGSMIPIIVIALRWGVIKGIMVGFVFGILQSVIDPYIVHPIQFLLDYPVAFSFLGIAGLFKDSLQNKEVRLSSFIEYNLIFLGVFFGILGRFISHIIAGVVFFKEFAGDQNVWVYSILYNGGYLGVELIVTVIIVLMIWKPIKDMNLKMRDKSN